MVAALAFAACSASQEPSVEGAELYANYCSACHGALGEGDGPVAAVMQVNVPNLRTLASRANGEFPRESVRAFIDGRNLPVSHGDRRMPIWGNVFQWEEGNTAQSEAAANRRINAIVDYLEQIQYK
jgi:mono/diheme cytochrome c family protein